MITDAFYMTPEDFKTDYRSMHGAGFSIAPIFAQSAWFRFHNRDPHIKNLYFAAAGAHPGAGMRVCYVRQKWSKHWWQRMMPKPWHRALMAGD